MASNNSMPPVPFATKIFKANDKYVNCLNSHCVSNYYYSIFYPLLHSKGYFRKLLLLISEGLSSYEKSYQMFDYFNVGLPTIPCFLSFLLAFSHAFSFIIKFGHDDHAYLVHIHTHL